MTSPPAKRQRLLFATGFNAFGQISPINAETNRLGLAPADQQHDDARCEQNELRLALIHAEDATIPQSNDLGDDAVPQNPTTPRVLFSGWTSTSLIHASSRDDPGPQSSFVTLGHHDPLRVRSSDTESESSVSSFHDAIGDHDGLIACLDAEGHLHISQALYHQIADASDNPALTRSHSHSSSAFYPIATRDSPQLGHIALAGNGHIAATNLFPPTSELTDIYLFPSILEFLEWYTAPLPTSCAPHRVPGGTVSLVAGTATFTLLCRPPSPATHTEIYTWGDPRHASLARATQNPHLPASVPARVPALSGLSITHIASGGWINAALSDAQALYIWGAGTVGLVEPRSCPSEPKDLKARKRWDIAGLEGLETEEVHLVTEIPALAATAGKDGEGEADEGADIIAVGVGNNHIVAVTAEGRVFGAGANQFGQLGLGAAGDFRCEWSEMLLPQGVRATGVECGPVATFVHACTTE